MLIVAIREKPTAFAMIAVGGFIRNKLRPEGRKDSDVSNDFSIDKALSGLVNLPKPPQTSRELAQQLSWIISHDEADNLDSAVALIDRYVKVKEAEARLEGAKKIGTHDESCEEHKTLAYCNCDDRSIVAFESSLAIARAELEKVVKP